MPGYSSTNLPVGFKIIERGTKLGIKFPFLLKDSFRSVFPSAVWERTDKEWLIGKSLRKRLDDWISRAAVIADEMRVDEDAELAEQEIVNLEKEIAEIRKNLETRDKARTLLARDKEFFEQLSAERVELLEKMRAAEDEVAAAEAEKQAAEAEARKLRDEVQDILSRICDISAIKAAHYQLTSAWSRRVNGSFKYREQYEGAQDILREQRGMLRRAGWESAGLHKLVMLNYNRPDRYRPTDVTWADILRLSEYESEEQVEQVA